jgi:hypothetical protein
MGAIAQTVMFQEIWQSAESQDRTVSIGVQRVQYIGCEMRSSSSRARLFQPQNSEFTISNFSFSMQRTRISTDSLFYVGSKAAMNRCEFECMRYRDSITFDQFIQESPGICDQFVYIHLENLIECSVPWLRPGNSGKSGWDEQFPNSPEHMKSETFEISRTVA